MKKPFLFGCSAFIFISILLFTGCQKNQVIKSSKEHDQELIQYFGRAGEIHNTGMDHMLKILQARKANQPLQRIYSITDTIAFSELAAIGYQFAMDSLGGTGLSFAQYYGDDVLIASPEDYDTPLKDLVTDALGSELSMDLEEALDQLEALIKNDDINTVWPKYDTLIYDNVSRLQTDLDKAAFIMGVSVAKSSLRYWTENIEEWENLKSEYGYRQLSPIDGILKAMAYIDCGGAVVGAIHAGLVGAVGGTIAIPVVGTAVGGAAGVLVGAIGGAILASGHAAVFGVIHWIIDHYL